ncbi:DUF4214 domain-containing protein [Streptomyces sp. ISL-100]|uniref:DUF4214 domain-containing protein n=1 Tax=Streptomyces sp. ISL-100 TaxID=2819173 RepID=UPI001BE6C284|nr:DUF4214 domain-containing protein [Streptomyces sp. ISL-100]MBT2395380.1 DUF4214 domain-containing protein [Streptomyces sp. ISL-100]
MARTTHWYKAIGAGLVAVLTGALLSPSAAAAAAGPVPYQFIAKAYTEGLGRAPDQPSWTAAEAQFVNQGCNVANLKAFGKSVLTSAEFNALGYDNTSRMMVAYRTILNRDPDAAGLAHAVNLLNNGAITWSGMLDDMYASPEFAGLSGTICSAGNPDYNFGTAPAPTVATKGAGFTGTQAQLQSRLNATPSGGTLALAQRAVVRISSSSLVVPPGVTLTTTGAPTPSRYADMGRIVRADTWPTFAAATIVLRPGAKLRNVWVDGQMGVPGSGASRRYVSAAYNVQSLSGTGNEVSRSRVGNSAGATNIQARGVNDESDRCVDNVYTDNLIEGYSSDHTGGNWTDGLSIGCEDSEVANNQIIDATDVPLILFGQGDFTQTSQMHHNVIVNAGQATFAAIGVDPWNAYPDLGDGPGVASSSFAGARIHDNTFWNNSRIPHAIGITVGTRAWHGPYAWQGNAVAVTNNTKGSLPLYAETGIVVAGMLNATVTGNSLPNQLVDTTSSCTSANVGAAVSAGYASGTIQGPFLDTDYNTCIG